MCLLIMYLWFQYPIVAGNHILQTKKKKKSYFLFQSFGPHLNVINEKVGDELEEIKTVKKYHISEQAAVVDRCVSASYD